MRLLLGFSAFVDGLNERLGRICDWLVLLACVVSAGNAPLRPPPSQATPQVMVAVTTKLEPGSPKLLRP